LQRKGIAMGEMNWKGAAELAQENAKLRRQVTDLEVELGARRILHRLAGMTLPERIKFYEAELARHRSTWRGERPADPAA
jgi:hypothetical protein